MLFRRPFTLLALAALASTQTTQTTHSPAQVSKAAADISSYLLVLATEPGYSAAAAALVTVAPSAVLAQIVNDPVAYILAAATATAQPTWFAALPSSAQEFFSNAAVAEYDLIDRRFKARAPVNAVKVGGAVLVAGGVVLALL